MMRDGGPGPRGGFEKPIRMTIHMPDEHKNFDVATLEMQCKTPQSMTVLVFPMTVAELNALSVTAKQAADDLEEIIVARATQKPEDQ